MRTVKTVVTVVAFAVTTVALTTSAAIHSNTRDQMTDLQRLQVDPWRQPAFPDRATSIERPTAQDSRQSTAATGSLPLTYVGSTMWKGTYGLKMSGDYAFLSMTHGLGVINLSDRSNPTWVAQLSLDGEWTPAITVAGNYAYVSRYREGMYIVDISDPLAPVLVGVYDQYEWAAAVTVAGSLAYLADDAGALRIVDVSEPASPRLVGSFVTGDSPRDVVLDGNLAYVVDWTQGLFIVDVSNPGAPTLVGHYAMDGYANGVAVTDNFAYVVRPTYENVPDDMMIFDVSKPASPIPVGTVDVNGVRLTVQGSRAYVTGYSFQVVDVSDPVHPQLLGSQSMQGSTFGVAVIGDEAVVARWIDGVRVLDVSDPTTPTTIGQYTSAPWSWGVHLYEGHAFVRGLSDLPVVDVSDPSRPYVAGVPVGLFGDFPTDLVTVRGYAYVTDRDSGLVVLDLAQPDQPVLVAALQTPGNPGGMTVQGDKLYLADSDGGLEVWDISNPAAPVMLGERVLSDLAYWVGVSGDYAYVVLGTWGLAVVDVSDPTDPSPVGGYPAPHRAKDVAVYGTHAYLLDDEQGIQILDISDPPNPVRVGAFKTISNTAKRLSIRYPLAFVAEDGNGLQVVDISVPTAPTLVATLRTSGDVHEVVADENFNVYIADDWRFATYRLGSASRMIGDVNWDGVITSSDVIGMVNFVFKAGAPPMPDMYIGDLNCSGQVTSADVISLVGYVFKSAPAPVCP